MGNRWFNVLSIMPPLPMSKIQCRQNQHCYCCRCSPYCVCARCRSRYHRHFRCCCYCFRYRGYFLTRHIIWNWSQTKAKDVEVVEIAATRKLSDDDANVDNASSDYTTSSFPATLGNSENCIHDYAVTDSRFLSMSLILFCGSRRFSFCLSLPLSG